MPGVLTSGQVEAKLAALTREQYSIREEIAALKRKSADREHERTKGVDWSKDEYFEWSQRLYEIKSEVFGISGPFRQHQKEAINVTLSGYDCFVNMPTVSTHILSCIHSLFPGWRQVTYLPDAKLTREQGVYTGDLSANSTYARSGHTTQTEPSRSIHAH